MQTIEQLLAEIARDHLSIPTLETHHSDSLVFHDLAVSSIEAALNAAFEAGVDSVSKQCAATDIQALLEQRREVAAVWCIEDVQNLRPDLNDDQAWQVLQTCDRRYDSEIGFTWLVIEAVADDLFPSPDEGDGE